MKSSVLKYETKKKKNKRFKELKIKNKQRPSYFLYAVLATVKKGVVLKKPNEYE